MDAHPPSRHGRYSYAGTIDRPGAPARRQEATGDVPTKKDRDRDENLEAVFKEGGKGSHVAYVTPSDNRGSGSALGAQINGRKDGYEKLPDGRMIRVFIKPPTDPVQAALARGRLLWGKHEA